MTPRRTESHARDEIRVRQGEEGEGSRSEAEQGDERGGREGGKTETSIWEKVAAALSALLVLGTISLMLYDGLSSEGTPPEIEIVTDTITATGAGYLVRFQAHNRGQTTAAGLAVEGELREGTESVETSEVVIDYVPAGGRRAAGLLFSRDPRAYTLRIRPKGYNSP